MKYAAGMGSGSMLHIKSHKSLLTRSKVDKGDKEHTDDTMFA